MSYDNGTLPGDWDRWPRDEPVLGPCGCDDCTPSDDGTYCMACGEDLPAPQRAMEQALRATHLTTPGAHQGEDP